MVSAMLACSRHRRTQPHRKQVISRSWCPSSDTPNPTHHTLKCEESTNVAVPTATFRCLKYGRGSYVRHYWGASPIGSRRAKPPISTPDAGVTGAGWSGGRGRASRRSAERSEIAKSRGRAGLATADTTARRALHPLRGATPVTGRDTRSEEVHCLRIGCSAPNHKNKRGICETTADTHKAPGTRAPGASAHSDQPTLHVAPSRPSATVTTAAARRSRSGPLGQHGPDQRIQRLVLGRSRTGRTRADTSLAARARQYVDRDSPATRPYKTLRISLTNQVADSLVPARRA